MRRVLWIIAVLLALWSALLALAAIGTVVGAAKPAAKNMAIKAEFERHSAFVNSYLEAVGELPTQESFEAISRSLGGDYDRCYLYHDQPLGADGYNFRKWPKGAQCYAISMWRGEWYEYYDSHSDKSTVDDFVTPGAWRRDALWPFAYSIFFGAPLVIALVKRRRKNAEPSTRF